MNSRSSPPQSMNYVAFKPFEKKKKISSMGCTCFLACVSEKVKLTAFFLDVYSMAVDKCRFVSCTSKTTE